MRCEHFEMLRQQLESLHHTHYKKTAGALTPLGFSLDPAAPWDAVFGAASRDEAFWTAEVKDKRILFLSRLAPAHSLLFAGATIDPPANLRGSGGPRWQTSPPTARMSTCAQRPAQFPACAFTTQAAWARDRLGAHGPLFATDSGGFPGTRAAFDAIMAEAKLPQLDTTRASGASAFGGHSLRRGGAQYLVRSGVEIWRIQT